MTTYEVRLQKHTVSTATVTVEAEDEEDAKDRALGTAQCDLRDGDWQEDDSEITTGECCMTDTTSKRPIVILGRLYKTLGYLEVMNNGMQNAIAEALHEPRKLLTAVALAEEVDKVFPPVLAELEALAHGVEKMADQLDNLSTRLRRLVSPGDEVVFDDDEDEAE
jgi:hypothetical protein